MKIDVYLLKKKGKQLQYNISEYPFSYPLNNVSAV